MKKILCVTMLFLMLLTGCYDELANCKKCRLVFGDVSKNTELGQSPLVNAEVSIISYSYQIPIISKIFPSKRYIVATTQTDENGHFFVIFDNFTKLENTNISVTIAKGNDIASKSLAIKNENDDLYFNIVIPTK